MRIRNTDFSTLRTVLFGQVAPKPNQIIGLLMGGSGSETLDKFFFLIEFKVFYNNFQICLKNTGTVWVGSGSGTLKIQSWIWI